MKEHPDKEQYNYIYIYIFQMKKTDELFLVSSSSLVAIKCIGA